MRSANWPSAAAEAEAALAAGTGRCLRLHGGRARPCRLRRSRGAQACFDRALALDPDNPAVLTGLAVAPPRRPAARCDHRLRCGDRRRARLSPTPGSSAPQPMPAGVRPPPRAKAMPAPPRLRPDRPPPTPGLPRSAARDGQIEAHERRCAPCAGDRSRQPRGGRRARARLRSKAGTASAARALLEPIVGTARSGTRSPTGADPARQRLGRLGDTDAAFANTSAPTTEFADPTRRGSRATLSPRNGVCRGNP